MKLISFLLLPIAVFALDQETIQRDATVTTSLESINMPGKLTEDLVDEEENKGHRSYIRAMVENVEKFGRKLYTYEDLSLSDSYKCYNRAGWCNQSPPSDTGSSEDADGSEHYNSFLWWSNSSSRRQRNLRGGNKKDQEKEQE